MLIHDRIARSKANGPGERAVVWLQGCTLSCRGCWNPETHAFNQTSDVLITDLVKWIVDQEVEGVTFSGGEPFQQAPALSVLMDMILESRPGMSIGSYTGYTHKELLAGNFQWWSASHNSFINGDPKLAKEILSRMDFIVAGRYNELKRDVESNPLCGSSNQEIVLLSKRYKLENFNSNLVEITVNLDESEMQITGFPEDVATVDSDEDKLGEDPVFA
jgi:anaerobic ribonucleoside-triphosphate reductase activating protein